MALFKVAWALMQHSLKSADKIHYLIRQWTVLLRQVRTYIRTMFIAMNIKAYIIISYKYYII